MTMILFTTTDLKSERQADFRRLLASVEANKGVPIRHHVLLQNADGEALACWRTEAPGSRFSALPGRTSLSAARNIMISEASAEQAPGEDDVVSFPDDDCWLPDGFLAWLDRTFAESTDLDLLICGMSLHPETSAFGARDVLPVEARQVVRLSSSNNMFLRGSLMATLGPFDPGLGLGTSAGGGEDTDYALRSYFGARRVGLIDRPLVGHRTADRGSAAKYFRGAMTVLARHASARPALARECARKVLVGGFFVGSGRLSVFEYIRGLREGAGALLGRRSAAHGGRRP
ncbi:glycosyltransferase family 2 protein [uncultured Enterovirga sp.]|uniref:glycosyltransferase family 2 protein n=1 Tax=uncultured Enterovirga sp. TaxID=2026352 RepID=UPI0035CC8AA3